MVDQTPRQPVAETDRCAAIHFVTADFHWVGFRFTLFSLLGDMSEVCFPRISVYIRTSLSCGLESQRATCMKLHTRNYTPVFRFL